jgi:hypothetical protein
MDDKQEDLGRGTRRKVISEQTVTYLEHAQPLTIKYNHIQRRGTTALTGCGRCLYIAAVQKVGQ